MTSHHSRIVHHLLHLLFPVALATILAGGGFAAWLRAEGMEQRLRQQLLIDTRTIAQAICPGQAAGLALAPSGESNPHYQRLNEQLTAYARASGRSVYTLLLSDDGIVLGPGGAAASGPGLPTPDDLRQSLGAMGRDVYASHQAVILGPHSGPRGTLVSALVPVCDPRHDRVLITAGMDLDGDMWRAQIRRVALAPLLISLATAMVLVAGNLAARRRRNLPAERRGAWRAAEVVAVALGGLIITASAVALVTDIQNRDREDDLRRMADGHSASVAGMLQDIHQYELPALARYFETSAEVAWDEFQAFVEPLAASSTVRSWGWAPRVPHDRRDDLENDASSTVPEGYRLFELAADGTRIPVAERDVYYPVLYTAPVGGNEPVLGFDLASEPARRAALEEAGRTGLSSATSPVPIVQGTGERALLIAHPVLTPLGLYPRVSSVNDIAHLDGYVLALLPLDVMLREAVARPGHDEAYVSLTLLQLRPDAPPTVLTSSTPEHVLGQSLPLPVSLPGRPAAIYPIFVFGRTYALVARPGPALVSDGLATSRWAIALTGALLTVLACGVTAMAQGRQWRLEQEVRARTAELSESQARYQAFINSSSDMVYIKDDRFRYVVVNDAQAEFFKLPPEDIIGRTDFDLMPRHAAETCRASDEAALAANWATVSEEMVDGRVYEATKFPVPFQNGRKGVGGFVRDVTERSRAREEVARNAARLRSLANILQYRAEGVQDLLDYALEEAVQLTGSRLGYIYRYHEDREEFVLNTWSREVMEACTIQEPQTVYQLERTGVWGEAVRQRKPIILNDFQAPHPLKRGYPEGHAPLHRFLTVPIIQDGRVVAVVGVANKDAAYDEADVLQLSLLMDGVWRGVEARQSHERIAHLNRVLRAMRDVNRLIVRAATPQQLVEETCTILVEARGYLGAMAVLTGPDDGPPTVAAAGLEAPFEPVLARAREGDLPPPCAAADDADGVHVLPDRREGCGDCPAAAQCATMDALCVRLTYEAERYGHLAIWVPRGQGSDPEEHALLTGMAADLGFALHNLALEAAKAEVDAERQRLEAQLAQAQKMEAIGRLAGGVAHDFNNMLGVISGYTDFVRVSLPPDSPAHDDLAEIERAAARSAELTRQLLTFARQQPTQPRIIDLNRAIADNERMLRRLMGEDIALSVHAAPDLWPVKIDLTQVSQILANLAANARDAIRGVGEVTIETGNVTLDEAWCGVRPGASPGDYVELAFSDSGVGMSREVQEHLFEPFFTTKEVGEGTGLGLATVYGIAQQNGGLIRVYSEPDQGTTFRIYLPRASDPAEEVPDATAQAAVVGGSETILLVEDEPQIVELCQRLLEGRGYRVLAAHHPEEALRLCAEHQGPIHLLVSDVVMPAMNGRDLAERVRELQPGIKVLFMSGYTTGVIARRGIVDTDVNYIQKPFDMNDFGAIVRRVIDGD